MKKLAIIHYLPIEYYPPVTNLLEIISDGHNSVRVFTTHNNKKREVYKNSRIKIFRTESPNTNNNGIAKLFKYMVFNFSVLFKLVFYKPKKILYYETYSAWPVYVYSKFFNSKVQVYIHFHEYFDKKWYKSAMRIVKWYHNFEKKFLFKRTMWISHTNNKRIKLFHKDHPYIKSDKMHKIPNYPPKNWIKVKKHSRKVTDGILKTVYVGALSLSDTYIKEYCNWVVSKNGKVALDIYAYNLHRDTATYLDSLQTPYINFYEEGIEYNVLPEILCNYDVGVILYKALSLNYKYNAPNKLFEYLSSGLEVWYPNVMLGIEPYKSSRVISLNFDALEGFSTEDRKSMLSINEKVDYQRLTAESALKPLLDKLKA